MSLASTRRFHHLEPRTSEPHSLGHVSHRSTDDPTHMTLTTSCIPQLAWPITHNLQTLRHDSIGYKDRKEGSRPSPNVACEQREGNKNWVREEEIESMRERERDGLWIQNEKTKPNYIAYCMKERFDQVNQPNRKILKKC